MTDDWSLARSNRARLSLHRYAVAVLPTAATEAHNLHLPEGQDVLHTTWIAEQCCAAAWKETASVLCLPALPFGVDCNLLDFPFTLHVSQAALDAVVRDLVLSLRKHGIRKVVLLNGHGGNEWTALVRQLQCDTDSHLFVCDWWKVGLDRYGEIFGQPDDHAGEMETSVALALYPELVDMEKAGSGAVRPFRFEALRQGWVRTSRSFARLNDHCAAGDPSQATAEKGRRYLELVVERITRFLVELARAPIDAEFPHCSDK